MRFRNRADYLTYTLHTAPIWRVQWWCGPSRIPLHSHPSSVLIEVYIVVLIQNGLVCKKALHMESNQAICDVLNFLNV